MSRSCDSTFCQMPARHTVPVSVHQTHDAERHYCDSCYEVFVIGVQHGRFHEAARYGCKPGRDPCTEKPKSFAFYHVHTFDHGISAVVGANSYRHAALIVAEVIAEGEPPGEGGLCCVEKLCAPENGGTGYYAAMNGQEQWCNILPNDVKGLSPNGRREIAYLASPNTCPFCHSKEINAVESDCDGDIAQEVTCDSCGKSWQDIYTLTQIILNP